MEWVLRLQVKAGGRVANWWGLRVKFTVSYFYEIIGGLILFCRLSLVHFVCVDLFLWA